MDIHKDDGVEAALKFISDCYITDESYDERFPEHLRENKEIQYSLKSLLKEMIRNAFVHGNRLDLSKDVLIRWRIADDRLIIEVADHGTESVFSAGINEKSQIMKADSESMNNFIRHRKATRPSFGGAPVIHFMALVSFWGRSPSRDHDPGDLLYGFLFHIVVAHTMLLICCP